MTVISSTFHPAYLLRGNRRFEGLVNYDMGRLVKCTTGWRPEWDRSKYILKPSLSVVLKVLKEMAKSGRRVSYDIETDGQHPLVCTVRCIAFWDGKRGICVPFVFRDGRKEPVLIEGRKTPILRAIWTPYWGRAELAQVIQAIQSVFDSCPLDTQNGQYDRLCLEARLGFDVPSPGDDPENVHDTIVAHHVVASYFPHDLGFLASLYTEAPYYKTTDEGEAWSASTDELLWQYSCDDVQVTYQVATKTRTEITDRAEDIELYKHDAWQERECQRWRHVGALVDPRAVSLLREHYGEIRRKSLNAMREELGKQVQGEHTELLNELMEKLTGPVDEVEDQDDGRSEEKFNPASLQQLLLLLRHLGIPLTAETPTGSLSTAKEFLLEARRQLLLGGAKPDSPPVAFLDFLFSWREAAKLESTYLYPELIPEETGLVWRISKLERSALGGLFGAHASFSVHGPPTGRLTSSRMNLQNQPADIRGIFIARPNHVLVTGDWSALEMRLGAILSGDPKLLKVFADYDAGIGPKPHTVNAAAIFGLSLTEDLPDKHPGCYRAAKVFAYAVAYGAGPTTVFDQVRKEMPDLEFKEFMVLYTKFKEVYPRLFEYQRDVVMRGTQHQYLDSGVLKRRAYFLERMMGEDSPEASKMQNFPYQSTAADIVSLANRRLMERVVDPWRRERLHEGEHLEQLAQVHDELLFEVPERLAQEFAVQYKSIAEETPFTGIVRGVSFKHWRLPVDVKVQKPLRSNAPSRWKPLHADSTCCGAGSEVEVWKESLDNVTWIGECGKCEKPFKRRLAA